MGGAWYALATIAIVLVIRWYLQNDTGGFGDNSKSGMKMSKPLPNPKQDFQAEATRRQQ
jgi:hypothetical protein